MSLKAFVNKYIVTIVMIPSIIGIHYGWTKVQNVESLVKEHEKQDLPIIIAARNLYNEYFNKPADPKKGEER
ncbi:uncharacterized protein LOC129799866 [Phlebotomus papatasi]|uniref:uncharacterized protein LOC129799866 n=1 Tax=Phlebotomus papatasi TaxID=29031 RepID=UPI002483CB47|nr:uncharacterized protein LOC129799866 [Phlebotomus papatasi]